MATIKKASNKPLSLLGCFTFMLTLKYAKEDRAIASIKEQFQRLVLAYRVEEIETLEKPELADGEKVVQGIPAIQDYLSDLEGELHSWYYCNC